MMERFPGHTLGSKLNRFFYCRVFQSLSYAHWHHGYRRSSCKFGRSQIYHIESWLVVVGVGEWVGRMKDPIARVVLHRILGKVARGRVAWALR